MNQALLTKSNEVASAGALKCAVCGEELGRAKLVSCDECGTTHHLDCWRFNKQCSAFACNCRRANLIVPGREKKEKNLVVTADYINGVRLALAVGMLVFVLMCLIVPRAPALVLGLFSVLTAIFFALATNLIISLFQLFFPARFSFSVDSQLCRKERTLLGVLPLYKMPIFSWRAKIVEVHLHQALDVKGHPESLYLCYADGDRELVYDRRHAFSWQRYPWKELSSLANLLAETTNSKVRRRGKKKQAWKSRY